MQLDEVSIEAAIKRGRLMLKGAPLLVMLFLFIGVGVLSDHFRPPGWLIGSSVIMSFVGGWLVWSVLVTRWRIWSLQRVRNTHALIETAVAEQLIWPQGSWLERTEIRSSEQRAILEALSVRFSTPDLWQDDPEVQVATDIHWSHAERNVTLIVGLILLGAGIYMILENVTDLWGWALVVIVVFVGALDIRKLRDKRVQIRLDEYGITLVGKPCIPWAHITNDRVVVKGSGDSSYTALEFWHPDGREEVKIDQMDLPKKELRHRLRVYRFRSGHFPTIVS